jgi:hypothetical protein
MLNKFRAIVGALILAGAAAAFSPAPANAHRAYPSWGAEDHVYTLWNSHCGNGSTWICINRKLTMRSAAVGDHSWAVYYSWQEARVDLLPASRWCDVYVRDDTHVRWVVQIYTPETCHG